MTHNTKRSTRLDSGALGLTWDLLRAGAVMVLGAWTMQKSAKIFRGQHV